MLQHPGACTLKIIRKVQVIVYTRTPDVAVLLLRRPPERGHIWQPVTGKLESADPGFAEGARRELLEETGIDGAGRVIETAVEFRFKKKDQDVVERVMGVELAGQLPVRISAEHVEYAWLPRAEALDRLYWDINKEGVRQVLDATLRKA